MSIAVINRVFASRRHGGSERLVLLALANYANDAGIAWPSVALLATDALLSPRQVQRVLTRLETDGVLTIERGVGRTHASTYAITLDALSPAEKHDTAMSPIRDEEKVTSGAGKGDISSEKVTSRVIKGDIAVSPEPYEPSLRTVREPLDIAGSPEPDPPPKPKPKRNTYPADFEAFWQAYPSGHGSKIESLAVWKTLAVDAELLDAILAGIDAWKRTKRWQDGFIRDAERFLKKRLWENPEAPTSSNGTAPRAVNQAEIDRLKAEAKALSESRPTQPVPGTVRPIPVRRHLTHDAANQRRVDEIPTPGHAGGTRDHPVRAGRSNGLAARGDGAGYRA